MTVYKLLYKRDDVVVTNVGGGLNVTYIGCLMKEIEGRVHAYGTRTDEKHQELTQLLQNMGCAKCLSLFEFLVCQKPYIITENLLILFN
jgi:hypothetical protein